MHMKKIRVTHKDGDMQGITLMYLINKYLKINRELWDKEGMVLNRYYKAILTRTIKASDKIVDRFKSQINYRVEKDVIKILDEVFTALVLAIISRRDPMRKFKGVYFYINNSRVEKTQDYGNDLDNERYDLGNYFLFSDDATKVLKSKEYQNFWEKVRAGEIGGESVEV